MAGQTVRRQQQSFWWKFMAMATELKRLAQKHFHPVRHGFIILVFTSLILYIWLFISRTSHLYSRITIQPPEEVTAVVFALHPKYPLPLQGSDKVRRILLERDIKRLERIGNSSVNEFDNNKLKVVIPAHGNVYPDGLYYVTLHVGRPSKAYYLDMDTGSDITWLQCDAPCRSCGRGPHELYKPRRVTVQDCRHPLCAEVQALAGGTYECEETDKKGVWTHCYYDREYADGSSTMGIAMHDFIVLPLSNGDSMETIAMFGCGYDQQGVFIRDPVRTDGVMGLRYSKAALPSQLAQKRIVRNVMGHCLGDKNGQLLFGDELIPSTGMTWNHMMQLNGFYQARLRSISYGAEEVIRMEPGGSESLSTLTFDSGTSFTYFLPEVYEAILSAVRASAASSNLVREVTDTTLPFCWGSESMFKTVADAQYFFKSIFLNFGGSRTMELTPEGYLIASNKGNVCLGILNAQGGSADVMNILGDISMRGYLVVYDCERGRIGWARKNCETPSDRIGDLRY